MVNAIEERAGLKMPGKKITIGEDNGINEDASYYDFAGCIFAYFNYWRSAK